MALIHPTSNTNLSTPPLNLPMQAIKFLKPPLNSLILATSLLTAIPSPFKPIASIQTPIATLSVPPPRRAIPPATIDPHLSHRSPYIHSTIQMHMPYAPNPIIINPFNSIVALQASKYDSCTLKATSRNCPIPLHHAAPTLSSAPLMALVLRDGYRSPAQMVLLALLKEYSTIHINPLKPKLCNKPTLLLTYPRAQNKNADFSHAETQAQNPLITHTHTESPSDNLSLYLSQQSAQFEVSSHLSVTDQPNSPTDRPPLFSLPPHINTPTKKKIIKGKQPPTRRSQRIRAKKQTENTKEKPSDKTSRQVKEIQFDLPMPETPLDVDTTLAILIASGLEINEQVEDMIQTAAKQNQAPSNADQDMPLTPLHDPIPPLAIPGFELPF